MDVLTKKDGWSEFYVMGQQRVTGRFMVVYDTVMKSGGKNVNKGYYWVTSRGGCSIDAKMPGEGYTMTSWTSYSDVIGDIQWRLLQGYRIRKRDADGG